MFTRKISRTREKLNRGLAHMERGLYKAAIKNFEAAIRKRDGFNLERDVAAWWMVNAVRYRKEWKKKRYGNAHLFDYLDIDHSGKAWSDVDIAAGIRKKVGEFQKTACWKQYISVSSSGSHK